MKSNASNTILTGLLAVSLLLSVIFCIRLMSATRDTRRLVFQARQVQFEQGKMQSLANECLEYSLKNPAIDPILESVSMTPKAARAAKAATK